MILPTLDIVNIWSVVNHLQKAIPPLLYELEKNFLEVLDFVFNKQTKFNDELYTLKIKKILISIV